MTALFHDCPYGGGGRCGPELNRRIKVLQTSPLTTWVPHHLANRASLLLRIKYFTCNFIKLGSRSPWLRIASFSSFRFKIFNSHYEANPVCQMVPGKSKNQRTKLRLKSHRFALNLVSSLRKRAGLPNGTRKKQKPKNYQWIYNWRYLKVKNSNWKF